MDSLVSPHNNNDDERRYARLEAIREEIDKDPAGIGKAQIDSINDSKKLSSIAMKLQNKRSAKASGRPTSSSKSAAPAQARSGGFDTGAMANKFAASDGDSGAGGTASTLGDVGLSSGNPYGMAAGAVLKVVGSVQAKRAKEAQSRANEENARRSKLMTAMARLGNGVGSLGMA